MAIVQDVQYSVLCIHTMVLMGTKHRYHLASWVNLTEQWPYRMSWIILYAELNEDSLEEMTGLKSIYDRVKSAIPTQKEVEPLLEMDR